MNLSRKQCVSLAAASLMAVTPAFADKAQVSIAGPRSVFTTTENIEIAVNYTNEGGNARSLPLDLRHEDGTTVTFDVACNAPNGAGQGRIVTLGPSVLKPGRYTATVRNFPAPAATFAVYDAEPQNAYFTGQWVHGVPRPGVIKAKGGWMYMNTDYTALHPRTPKPGDLAEAYVAAGMKPYAMMILGGGHQLDLDLRNDWGDPWVQRTITWRMQLAALSNRIYPIAGLHGYDEAGLTWWPLKDATGKTIDMGPFTVPHQLDEFKRLTGKELPTGKLNDTLPQYAAKMDDWLQFMDLRMKYLEQAWHASRWGTDSVYPGFTTLNQVSNSYAAGDTTDGVDGRQARPYDVISGHGGYSDLPFGTMQPLRAAEAAWAFSRNKPHYYVPAWYVHSWASMRNAVWMSWATKVDGIIYTPDIDASLSNAQGGYLGTHGMFELAEINRRMMLVGGVMNNLKKQWSPVAVLHSPRQVAWDIAQHNTPEVAKSGVPPYVSPHNSAVDLTYFRIMEAGIIPNWIDEAEAVSDGATLLRNWKVIYCPRLTTITPELRKVLGEYIAAGGKLVQAKDDVLQIPGAVRTNESFAFPHDYQKEQIGDAKNSPAATDLAFRKWSNAMAPTFAADLKRLIGTQPYESSNPEVFVNVHRGGTANYLLIANNAQDKANPRGQKHELIPAATEITVPAGGVIYDLFNGGTVPVTQGRVRLSLNAGDGACLVHLPQAPGQLTASARNIEDGIALSVNRPASGPLPIRVRLIDPSGKRQEELFRATSPTFNHNFKLGANRAPGEWRVEVFEWLTGQSVTAKVKVGSTASLPKLASVDEDAVSIYFDDERRIRGLLAGKSFEPDYTRLNWDAKRVFGLNPRKFAIFGDDDTAERVAAALIDKGMTVEVNPPYEIRPFQQEENRGGAGPLFREKNFENIYAHTIVLPGHPLAKVSAERGHINRSISESFPGPGRAFVQWGVSCYQAGWQNVFVLGDETAGVQWLLNAINGTTTERTAGVTGSVQVGPLALAKAETLPELAVSQEIRLTEAAVGIGSSPDGSTLYSLLYDGSVAAYDKAGKRLWNTPALFQGATLAVSPNGERIAVGGYPGISILDARTGKVLATTKAEPTPGSAGVSQANEVTSLAWNAAGTLVAGGWLNPNPKDGFQPLLLDANGKQQTLPAEINGAVMGVYFVPGTNTLLLGADKLTAVDTGTGVKLWESSPKGASTFDVSPDGKTVAFGGWDRTAGVLNLMDGKGVVRRQLAGVIGGVAYLPGGDVAVAVWGADNPLMVFRNGAQQAEPLFQSDFGFQNVRWSPAQNALVAAEQGGRLWLLSPNGKPIRTLSTDAGTTAYRLAPAGNDFLVSRMNRVLQKIRF